jgi:2-keto-4-pentenoate hydratase/2-oxohepta-3-ene-1,7-dioic acid hydratase in catechol pathway
LPLDIIALIRGGEPVRKRLAEASAFIRPVALESVRLHAPIPHPPEFLGIGLNYRDHAAEAGLALPTSPLVFNKQTSCIVGPTDDVMMPNLSSQLDYEAELGIVIGDASRNLTTEEASAAIFGYLVVNDVSVRDWQFKNPTHTLGKSFDTHGPIGPWVVTADAILDPQKLDIRTRINNDVLQSSNTSQMIFSCAEIVAFLSLVMTLQPGTIIATGTPAGVGLCQTPPRFLVPGDHVVVDIEGIGQLANRVVTENGRRKA